MKGEYYIVGAVAFSPSGKQLVTASVDGTRLWDLRSGKEVRRFENPFHLGTEMQSHSLRTASKC